VNAEAFSRHLQQHYMKQFFLRDQRVVFSFSGVPFMGAVTAFDILSLDGRAFILSVWPCLTCG
jgi:hypothetical protein